MGVCQIVCDLEPPTLRWPTPELGCCTTEKNYTFLERDSIPFTVGSVIGLTLGEMYVSKCCVCDWDLLTNQWQLNRSNLLICM